MKEEDIRKRETFTRYLELVQRDVNRLFSDKKDFIAIDCPACKSSKYHFQFKKMIFEYVLCDNCGTLFVNPRPSLESLLGFYVKSESSAFWVEKFFKPVAETRREKIFKPRAEYVRDNFGGLSRGTAGEVGAGFGIFLEELSKLWPEARLVAIEPSNEMADICRQKKLEVVPSAVEQVEGWDNKFDLIAAYELFEHLHRPEEFVQKVFKLLKPGGYFVFTTLNGEGFDIQILWERSKSVTPPHHLNFFNPESVKLLLRSNGFNDTAVATPGKLDWDIVEGMFLNEGVDPGRFWKLVSQKGGDKGKEALQKWISENGFSSHMRITARKPL